MSAVTGVLQDLVRRRLWPVAVLLIAAAVAAPVLLAAEPEPVAPVVAGTGLPETLPIASLVDDFSADARRRVLGVAKDPFTPTGRRPKAAKADTPPSAGSPAGDATVAPGGGSSASGASGGASAGGGSAPTGGAPAGQAPTPATTPAPATDPDTGEETYALHSLKVRWNDKPQELERLEPLPNAEDAAIIYLGLLEDAKTAVFLLDAGVTTDGDGDCRPSPEDCQRVHLRKGETQFFSVPRGEDGAGVGAEHQLDLVSITTKRTTSAAKARKAFAASSKTGRRALRKRTNRLGRLRYDARTGLLGLISVQAHRTAVARAAARR